MLECNQNEIKNIEDGKNYTQGYKKGVLESFNIFNSILYFYDKYKNISMQLQSWKYFGPKWSLIVPDSP